MSVALDSQLWGRVRGAVFAALVIFVAAVGQAQTSAPKPAGAPETSKSGRVVLYASMGAELTQYDVDVEGATLVKRGSVALPENVQYAWPHPSHKYVYVIWSNRPGEHHGVSAFRIDPVSGELRPHGDSVSLSGRPIHVTTDVPGTHLLIAYNEPSGLTVHRLRVDGTIGEQVRQPAPLDVGIYAHQVRVDPSNKMVILVTRGNNPEGGKPEDPGALKIFTYNDGVLTNRASIAPGGGFGFGPRHLDFSGPFVFVSLERQNTLQVYRKLPGNMLSSAPLFTKDPIIDRRNIQTGQQVGTVHVHPNGRFVYQANRDNGTVDFDGKPVFDGGQNTIAVYSINRNTGEPTLIQNLDTQGITPRTFALDPSGRILVAANQQALLVRDGQRVRMEEASLAVCRVRGDGTLDFVRKYDVETDRSHGASPAARRSTLMYWMGLVSLP